ncbi:hypothetical protein D1831_00720 [Lactiplantibacillus garii]|uniref:Uncharacterized protein n=1 Tax=Lactiplantibacillus garii TaxID=2306423 RepID=A0A3R8JAE1_9LACO|nr:hypothetical protein [Lactiplantibacillus garii]RRK11896.1 hypothetical protein D1831_00720 [Lactiplantibacillus garii]
MEQWYKEAREYLQHYRLYHKITGMPFNDSLNVGKSERIKRLEVWCKQVTGAVDAIANPKLAELIRDEYIIPGGGRKLAQAKLNVSAGYYCTLRKQAVREWWRLANELY